jgi:hypothetical protein
VRHPIVFVLDYPAGDWATEYQLTEADADNDFAAAVRGAIDDGGLREALERAWPMMRGHITAHTVDQLDSSVRDELLHQLHEAQHADLHEALLGEVRAHLAAHAEQLSERAVRWVLFRTAEYDDGYFLTGSNATVHFTDGDAVTVDFDGSNVDDLLTDLYGTRGSRAGLGIDLTSAAVEYDDYGDNLPERLGIPSTTRG